MTEPESLLTRLLSAVGPVGKRVALARLRPKLEPAVVRLGLAWEDATPAMQLVDSLEELQAAVAAPEAFLQKLQAAAGPAAKALLVARLRPVLSPLLRARGLGWVDIEMMASVEELQKALAEPEAYLDDLLQAAGP